MFETTLRINHAAGLHARPLAAFVKLARGFDAEVQVENLTSGKGPVSGKSAVHLLMLAVQQGQQIRLRTSGTQAEEALAALVSLVERDFESGTTA
ncbi:MAG: HPr family phosphocarrier protein [Chloroflexaceae bacterium]|jgi:phosphotransferase system HPr (HPr) family protein|nr:HPr family phosphocarrier protein [Chloroflexaceae bacterium]